MYKGVVTLNRLKNRRLELGMTLEQVGEIVGVAKSTVTKWESGMIENMKRDKIALLAKALQVSPAFIMGIAEEVENPLLDTFQKTLKQLDKGKQIHVLNFAQKQLDQQKLSPHNQDLVEEDSLAYRIVDSPFKPTVEINGILAAGDGCVNYDKEHPIKEVEVDYVPNSYDLAFEVRGDSMYPTFRDSEIVFVKKTTDVYNGMIAAVEINELAYLKKVYIESKQLRLVSLNREIDDTGKRMYPDFFADEFDNIYIIGKVLM